MTLGSALTDPDQLLATAQHALQQARLDDGIDLLHRALESAPQDPRLFNALGIAQSRKGHHTEARTSFEKAVRLNPNAARYWYNLGTATQAAGQILQAGRYYQVASRIDPSYHHSREALDALRRAYPNLPLGVGAEAQRPAVPGLPGLERTQRLGTPDAGPPHITLASTATEGIANVEVLDHTALRYPGLSTRITALLFDVCVIQVLWLGAIVLMNLAQQQLHGGGELPNGYYLLAGPVAAFVYVVGAAMVRTPTLGKRVLRLQLVGPDGLEPSTGRRVARAALSAVSIATVAGYLGMALNPRRQSLHDWISSTYVVGRVLDPGTAIVWIAGLLTVNFYVCRILLAPQLLG